MVKYMDPLICVTKYRSSLDPWINIMITASRTAPAHTDYLAWHVSTHSSSTMHSLVPPEPL
jgi:hypothetical protein